MHPPPPPPSHRLSTQSSSSSASANSSTSDSSSYHPPRPGSSSSNGRLTPASQRLSVHIPDNRPFIPSLVVAANAGGAGGERPESSLSRSWGAEEGEGEGEDEDEWADADEEREDRREEDEGEDDDERGAPGGGGGAGRESSAPSTPISLPPIDVGSGDDEPLHDPARDSFPLTMSSSGDGEPEGEGGEGLGIVGLGVGGSSSFSRRDGEGRRMRSHAAAEEEGEAAHPLWKEERQHVEMAFPPLAELPPSHGGSHVDMSFPPLGAEVPPAHEVPTYETATSSSHSSFPSSHGASPSESSRLSRPSLTSQPSAVSSSSRSLRPSTTSTAPSSNSSTLSLPTAPPVDLSLPNVRPGGTYVSVANSHMASLAANNAPVNRPHTQSGGARSFFSNLLNRSPRANSTSPRFSPSPSSSPTTSPNPSAPPRSPSAPLGWQYQHPAVASLQSSESLPHSRSTSMPTIPGSASPPNPRDSSDLYRPASQAHPDSTTMTDVPQRRTPRAFAAATFAGLTRSASLGGGRAGSPRLGSSPTGPTASTSATSSSRAPPRSSHGNSPVPTIGFATPPLPSSSSPSGPPPPPPTLQSIGLKNLPLTPAMSVSRNGQPLCGALLDNKYLLIGTTVGLDFLPLPLPGSLPMKQHGSRKRKEVRKPIPLIKRTRFKELAILAERSNILLAIAGRNDHIRVYALDGIRAMIEKKMQELDLRDGYPVIQDASIFEQGRTSSSKGKGRAAPPSSSQGSSSASQPSRPISTFPAPTHLDPSPSYQFPPSSAPPPDYTLPQPSPRRRPPSWHSSRPSSVYSTGAAPSSPVRISSRTTPTSASFVRAVPTNPPTPTASSAPRGSVSSMTTVVPGTPRTLRGQKSREFIAGRKGTTTATMNAVGKRRSRADLQTPSLPGSRRSSVASGAERRGSRRGSARGAGEEDEDNADAEHLAVPPLPTAPSSSSSAALADRRPSAVSEAGWATDTAPSPLMRPRSRMEPRAPIKPQNPLERSPTSDLAEFLRDSGPEMHSPEMDSVLATSRGRRRSSITDNLLQVAKDAHLFPATGARTSPTRPGFARSVTTSHVAGPALYADDGAGGRDELVEMLQESAAEVANDARRASMNDFRRPLHEQGANDARRPSLTPREARSPLLKQQERSPALELAELLRETGPADVEALTTGTSSLRSNSSRPSPREAATPRLGAGQKSPSMELAALLKETGPEEDDGKEKEDGHSSGSSSLTPPKTNEAPFSDPFASSRPSPSTASALKGKGPESASSPAAGGKRLLPRSPVNMAVADESTDEAEGEPSQQRRKQSLTLAEAIRAGPPKPSTSTASSSSGLGISNVPPPSSSPNSRASKRWTMSGVVGSKLLSRPRSSSQSSTTIGAPPTASPLPNRPASSASGRISSGNSTAVPPRRSQDSRSSAASSPWEMVADPMERAASSSQARPAPSGRSAAASSSDYKRRPATSLHRSEPPTLPASSQIPPDAHPANSASPLEYVKLARTKGARLLRAAETKKRTYLAVLCGEEGERIELFTGSRSISLSLNRTFVLPETPRTVEFQLQGDDLVDIYLVYNESIFALEPATVRVREVGVGRGERRARRERERRMRNLAATSRAPVEETAAGNDVRSPALHSALHPADHALQEPAAAEDSQAEGEDTTQQVVGRSPSPAERPRTTSAASGPADAPPPAFPSEEYPVPPAGAAPSAASSQGTASIGDASRSNRSSKSSAPYSTFQQLAFVPPVPSSVLSSAWTIPPLYTDVVAGSPAPPAQALFDDDQPQPAITVTGANGAVSDAEESLAASMAAAAAVANGADLPLLSPISLLGGAALRQNGPPGLFFVSKGRNLSGIVTADGKSIIKRPLVWSHDRHEPTDPPTDIPQRIEVLVVGGKRTVVVKLSPFDVKCISVDGISSTSPFSPALTVSPSHSRPSIQFLATHSPSQQLLFAQTVGSSSYTIQCLAAASY
ncbi:hypothetical protein JCM6882_000898 [Rhodosporidiobolus microsporus]